MGEFKGWKKRRILRGVVCAMVAALALSGCGRGTIDSSQLAKTKTGPEGKASNNIDRSYFISFDQEENHGSVLATFSVSGDWFTTVRLSSPAQIVVNGQKLHDSQLLSQEVAVTAGLVLPILSPLFFLASGTHYSAHLPSSSLLAVQTISWTDQFGQIFTDQIKIQSAELSRIDSQISPNKEYSLEVRGQGDLGERQRYSARIEQIGADGALNSIYASSRNGSIRFAVKDLEKLTPGSAVVNIERSVQFSLNTEGSGRGRATATYRLSPIEVKVLQ